MALAAPTQLATRSTNTNGQTSWATASVTFPAGSLGILEFDNAGGSAYPTAVSDSVSGGWTIVQHASRASLHWTITAYKFFPSSTTCVVTTAFASSNETFGWLGYAPGADPTTPKDLDTPANTFGASLALTTSPNTKADDDQLVTALAGSSLSTQPTWPTTGFTSLFNPTDATRGHQASFEYRLVTGGIGTVEATTITYPSNRNVSGGLVTWRPAAGAGSTPISGSDSATGTDAQTDLSATAAGSDTSTGTDAGTVSATAAGADSGTGAEGQALLVTPPAGSDSSTGTDTGTVSASLSGADSGTATDTGTLVDLSATQVSGSDSGTGTETGTVSATAPGSESGSGSDAGAVSATLASSDAATATDDGTVVDLTGGPIPVSGSDAGTATDSGVVVDLTPPPPDEEDLGDVSSIYGEPPRHLTDSDHGVGFEGSRLVDLTPRKPVTIKLPEKVRKIFDGDGAVGTDGGSLWGTVADTDSGKSFEESDLQVTADLVADADDGEFLMILGLLSD